MVGTNTGKVEDNEVWKKELFNKVAHDTWKMVEAEYRKVTDMERISNENAPEWVFGRWLEKLERQKHVDITQQLSRDEGWRVRLKEAKWNNAYLFKHVLGHSGNLGDLTMSYMCMERTHVPKNDFCEIRG